MIEMDESSRGSAASETKGLRGNFQECLNLEMDNALADREERPQQKSTADSRNFGQIIQQQHSLPNGYSPSGNTNDINSPSSIAIEPNSTIKKEEPNSAGAKQSFNTAALEAAIETKNQISGTAIDQQEDQQHSANNSTGTINSEEQLSPNSLSLRRSSRVSALNAKKKLQQSSQSQIGSNKEKEQQQSSGTLLTILQPAKTEVKIEPQTPAQSATEKKTSTPEMVQEHQIHGTELVSNLPIAASIPNEENSQHVRVSALKKKLKRKLDDGIELDQYDCKFGIRLDAQGDVVMMSDDSEISSLNEEQVADLKERFENAQKQEVSDDIQTQRELQIAELEAALRLEEAKLLMMKKLRQSQQLQDGKKQQDGILKLAPGVGQNPSGQAYKPKVAVISQQMQQQNAAFAAKMNGTTHTGGKKGKGGAAAKSTGSDASFGLQGLAGAAASGGIQLSTLPPQHLQVIQQLYERLSQNPQQMANLIKTLPPPTGQALTELLRQYAVAQASAGAGTAGQQNTGTKSMASSTAAHSQQSIQPLSQAQIDAANKHARELTQQKIAKARQQLRRELEQMVTSKLPLPKGPPPDLQFIPNGNQPEFAYLLGLDLTVQRVLKDKQMFRKPDFPPYQCEECETDFTTSWKAICGENEDYHLYCERCVRQAQKRKICQDNKNLLTRAFQQIKEREKEFERQVAAGKFNEEPILPTPQMAPSQTNKVSQQQNIISNSATNAAATLSQSALKGNAAAALQQFSQQNAATAALNLTKSGTTSGVAAAATAMANAAIKNASTASGQHQQQKTAGSATTGGSRRSTNATAGNANNSAAINNQTNSSAGGGNPLAALFQQNPLIQQQFATMAAISNSPMLRQLSQIASNPMMLAAMAQNPMIFQQLLQSAMAAQNQRSQQQNTTTTTTTSSSNTNNASSMGAGAAAALAQFAQKSNQAQQQHRSSATSSMHHQTSTAASNTTQHSSTTNASTTSNSNSSNANNQSQQLAAAMAAYMMNPTAASNPLVQLSQLSSQNPQILSQLSSHPQFRQVMQMYMQQQMKAAGGKK